MIGRVLVCHGFHSFVHTVELVLCDFDSHSRSSLWTKDPTWRDVPWSDVQYMQSKRQTLYSFFTSLTFGTPNNSQHAVLSSESSLVQQFYPQRMHHFTKSGNPWILRYFWRFFPLETDGAGFTCGLWTLFHLLSQAAGASGSQDPVMVDLGRHGLESLHTLVVHMYRYYISDTLW